MPATVEKNVDSAPSPPPRRDPAPILRKPVQTAGLGNCYYDSVALSLLAGALTTPPNAVALKLLGEVHAWLRTFDLKNPNSPEAARYAAETQAPKDFLDVLLKRQNWRPALSHAFRLFIAKKMQERLTAESLCKSDDALAVEFYTQLKKDFVEFKKDKTAYQDITQASRHSFSQVPAIQSFFEANEDKTENQLIEAFKASSEQAAMLAAYIQRISTDRAWADSIVQQLVYQEVLGVDHYQVNTQVPSRVCVQLHFADCHFSPLLSVAELAALNGKIPDDAEKLRFIDSTALITSCSFKSLADFMQTQVTPETCLQTYTPADFNCTAAKEAPKKAELNNKTILITYVEASGQRPAEAVSLTLEENSETKKISLKAEHSKDEKTPLEKQYQRIADNLFLTAKQLSKANDGRYRFDIDSVNHEDKLELIAKSLYEAGFAEVFYKGEKLQNKAAVADAGAQTDALPVQEPVQEPAPGITLTASVEEPDPTEEVRAVLTGLVDQVVKKEEVEEAVDVAVAQRMEDLIVQVEQAQKQAEQAAAKQAQKEAQEAAVQRFLQQKFESLCRTITEMMMILGVSAIPTDSEELTVTTDNLLKLEELFARAERQILGLRTRVGDDQPRDLSPEFAAKVDAEEAKLAGLGEIIQNLNQAERRSRLSALSTNLYRAVALSAGAALSSYAVYLGLQFLKTQALEIEPLPYHPFACDTVSQRCEFLDPEPEYPLMPYVNAVDSMVCQPLVGTASQALVPFYRRTVAPVAANLVTELVPSATLLAYFVGAHLREAIVAIPRGLVFTPVAIAAAESLPSKTEAQLSPAISKVPAVNYSTLQSAMNLLWPVAYVLGAVNPATAVAGLAIQCATTLFSSNASCELASNTTEFVTRK